MKGNGSLYGETSGLADALAAVVSRRNGDSATLRRTEAREDRSTGWDRFGQELERARRYERSFALVRIRCHGGRSLPGTLEGTLEAGATVRSLVRSVDHTWTSEDDVYVLLPECQHEHAEGLIERIADAVPEIVESGRASVASFPADGLTLGALTAVLDEREEAVGGAAGIGGRPAWGAAPGRHQA